MITWVVFKGAFLEKYFPTDVRSKEEVEFLELKQENMIVADYAVKFEELSRFCPHYNGVKAAMYKCIKFENELRLEIKKFIGVSDNINVNQNRGKPYVVVDGKGKYKFKKKNNGEKSQSVGGSPTPLKYFKCGVLGHHVVECSIVICFKCGKACTQCQNPKKTQDVKYSGKMFALNGAEASKFDSLVRCTCFINNINLITIIDIGETHSFISTYHVKRSSFVVSDMNVNMVIDILANGSVTTSLVCLKCP
ncbi:uncharacterized protein LOC127137721 [Lathyrus oleraceus]|uniref:uncharacterized protein LOC127137721 n=1 Tax=Pisum sativum TaxID=3888 RepID=UPI0021D0EBD4|nr:uncharacterized protein LOC127137721 [Pisum sativum]